MISTQVDMGSEQRHGCETCCKLQASQQASKLRHPQGRHHHSIACAKSMILLQSSHTNCYTATVLITYKSATCSLINKITCINHYNSSNQSGTTILDHSSLYVTDHVGEFQLPGRFAFWKTERTMKASTSFLV